MKHTDYFRQSEKFGRLSLFELTKLMGSSFIDDARLAQAEKIEVFTLIAVSLFGGDEQSSDAEWNELLKSLRRAKDGSSN